MNPESQVPQQQQAAPQPPPRPPTLPPPPIRPERRPSPSPLPTSFLAICLAGVVLIGIGVIVVTSSQLLVEYDGYYYDGDYDRNLMNNLMTIGGMIGHIGTMTLVIGLLITGFVARNIGQNTRMGLFIATGLVVGLWLGLRLTYSIYP